MLPNAPQLFDVWTVNGRQVLPEQQPVQLVALQEETAAHLPKKQPSPVPHAEHV